jgi:hypothetical protein
MKLSQEPSIYVLEEAVACFEFTEPVELDDSDLSILNFDTAPDEPPKQAVARRTRKGCGNLPQ